MPKQEILGFGSVYGVHCGVFESGPRRAVRIFLGVACFILLVLVSFLLFLVVLKDPFVLFASEYGVHSSHNKHVPFEKCLRTTEYGIPNQLFILRYTVVVNTLPAVQGAAVMYYPRCYIYPALFFFLSFSSSAMIFKMLGSTGEIRAIHSFAEKEY